MSQKRIQQIEQRIDRIKRTLLEIGPMRPGSLTRQYKDPQNHTGAYWQISYTRRMKSRTQYVRQECVKELRRRIATHKRFKRLVDQWIDLSIEHSRLTMQMEKWRGSGWAGPGVAIPAALTTEPATTMAHAGHCFRAVA